MSSNIILMLFNLMTTFRKSEHILILLRMIEKKIIRIGLEFKKFKISIQLNWKLFTGVIIGNN